MINGEFPIFLVASTLELSGIISAQPSLRNIVGTLRKLCPEGVSSRRRWESAAVSSAPVRLCRGTHGRAS